MSLHNNWYFEIHYAIVVSSLPDLGALSTPEIEIPTLNMDSDSLNSISLSGIISQFIHLPEEEGLVKGGGPGLVYQVTPAVTDMMQHQQPCHGLESSHNNYNIVNMGHGHNSNKPFISIIEQPKSNSLRFPSSGNLHFLDFWNNPLNSTWKINKITVQCNKTQNHTRRESFVNLLNQFSTTQ